MINFSDISGSLGRRFLGRRRFLAGAACLCAPSGMEAQPSDMRAAMLFDPSGGRALHAHRADEPHPPASLAKVMTLYATFDALDAGALLLSSRVSVSATAAGQPPLRLGLAEGSSISVQEAIGALATRSANDAACAVAEHLGRSEARFAAWMNVKARRIGMYRTRFINATGLPDERQTSTARDLAQLGARVWSEHDRYCDWLARTRYTWGGTIFRAHTEILSLPSVIGAKTGYTRAAGYNLMAWVRRSGALLVGVVLGHDSPKNRDAAMADLLSIPG